MKKFLFLFSSFFSVLVFSQTQSTPYPLVADEITQMLQEGLPKGQLLITKDSLSFYSFTKTGVYEFSFTNNELSKSFSSYSKELPSELTSVPLNNLRTTVSEDGTVYFLYPGGGLLFVYENNQIKRIDRSFAHRNQFSGHFFCYKNTPYLMGGYGYWKSNSLLTKFNFQTKEWDYIETRGQIPELGVNKGSFVVDNDILYVFDFYEKIDDKDQKNDNLYELDLKSLKWEKKGSLNSLFDNDIQKKIVSIRVPFNGTKYLQKSDGSKEILIIEPSKNSVKLYENESLSLMARNAIVVGSKIIYSTLSADRSYESLVVKDFSNGLELKSEAILSNDFNLFVSYFLIVALFVVFLLGITFLKFKNDALFFVINGNNLSGLNKSIVLSNDEKFILELLSNSKNNSVDNVFFLNYFKNPALSEDANIKRKNKAISDLNLKFKTCFELDLILKTSNPLDSRQVVYKLNPKVLF